MALARVVSFEGVTKERIEELKREMAEGERPEGLPATELIVLHNPESEKSLAIVFFETADDYKQGDEALNAMSRPAILPAAARRSRSTKSLTVWLANRRARVLVSHAGGTVSTHT